MNQSPTLHLAWSHADDRLHLAVNCRLPTSGVPSFDPAEALDPTPVVVGNLLKDEDHLPGVPDLGYLVQSTLENQRTAMPLETWMAVEPCLWG